MGIQTLAVRAFLVVVTTAVPCSLGAVPANTTVVVHRDAQSFVRGIVVDDSTGEPIPEARIRVPGTAFDLYTSPDGSFTLERMPSGSHTLLVSRIGYRPAELQLEIGTDALSIVVRLGTAAVPLEPLSVRAFSQRLESVGFYERQRRGVGQFVTVQGSEVGARLSATDFLRRVTSVSVRPQPVSRAQTGMSAAGRGRCHFAFLVDGARMLPDFHMEMLAPQFIEGIEFYRSNAELPAPFRAVTARNPTETGCGILVVWTRMRH